MSPGPFVREKESPATMQVPVKPPEPAQESPESSPKPMVLISDLDSYILERQKEQPKSLEEAVSRAELTPRTRTRHRFTLADALEKHAYDCSHGTDCRYHKWQYHEKENRWEQLSHGEVVFAWKYKDKRAVDRALQVHGFLFVNRAFFPDVPKYLFAASGGIEIGDAILMFLPIKKALEIRQRPGEQSLDRLKSRMTLVDPGSQDNPPYVMMTGNVKDQKFYKPEIGPERQETSEEPVPGVLTEGRDF